jgi:hypothetical protein
MSTTAFVVGCLIIFGVEIAMLLFAFYVLTRD